MESRANAIAAGLFVLLLTIGLIASALWLTTDSLNRVHYLVVARIPISGLHAKAAVRLRGVDVGRVDSIAFDPRDPRTILVSISVDTVAPLTRGTYGQLGYQGVTGLSFIALDDDGSNNAPLLAPGAPDGGASGPPRIELRPSLFDQLGGSGQDLLREAGLAAKRINAALSEENLARLSGTLRNTEAATQELASLAHALQPAATGLAGLERHTDTALVHLDLLLGELHGMSSQLREHIGVLDDLGNSARTLGASASALEAHLDGQTLPRVDGAVEDLSRSARSLERMMDSLQTQPQGLLFGRQTTPGPGETGFTPPAGSHR